MANYLRARTFNSLVLSLALIQLSPRLVLRFILQQRVENNHCTVRLLNFSSFLFLDLSIHTLFSRLYVAISFLRGVSSNSGRFRFDPSFVTAEIHLFERFSEQNFCRYSRNEPDPIRLNVNWLFERRITSD